MTKLKPITALSCTDCQLNLFLKPSNKRCFKCLRAKVPYGLYEVNPIKLLGFFYGTSVENTIVSYVADDFVNIVDDDNEPESLTLEQAEQLIYEDTIKVWLGPSPQVAFEVRLINDFGLSSLAADFDLESEESFDTLAKILSE